MFLVRFVILICCFCCPCNSSCKDFNVKNKQKIRLQGALKNCHLEELFVILTQQHSYTCIIPDTYLLLMCTLKSPVMSIAFLGKLLYVPFLDVVFVYCCGVFSVMYLLLQQNLTGLNEMSK